MPFRRRIARPGSALLVLVLTGCAAAVETTRVEDAATAGTKYAQAVQGLLDESSNLLVDANSEKLLQGLALAGAGTIDQLQEQDQALRANLTEIRLLGRQLDLLAAYFTALKNLATSDAPSAFASQIESTASSLSGLSEELRGSPLLKDEASGTQLAQGLGGLVVRGIQARALRRELERRKETIDDVLALHERLFAALRAQVMADAQLQEQHQYDQQVVQPFTTEGALATDAEQQAWIDARRKHLSQPILVQQLDAAAAAARALRSAWAKALRKDLGPADIQAVIEEVEPIVADVAALQKAAEAPAPADDDPVGGAEP
jgi:hypothetical protein